MTESTSGESHEHLRARARHYVYERLALASAAIWVMGTFILMITIVPYIARPQPYILMASVIPLIPAVLPWLFWGLLTDLVVRRWTESKQ